MYKVIKTFVDLQDGNYKYDVGDTYPREGVSALPSRVKELAGKNNKLGEPLIEEIPETEETPKKEKRTKAAEKAEE